MLDIILQIFAIIGIVILCLLGIFLLLICVVLFVPVRYNLLGTLDSKLIYAKVKISFLLHLLTIVYIYPEPGSVEVRIFGKKIWDSSYDPEKLEVETNKQESKPAEVTAMEVKSTEENKKEFELLEKNKVKKEKNKKSIIQRVKEKTSALFQKIKYTIKSIYDRMKKIITHIKYYWELLIEEENKLLLLRCKKQLKKLFFSIRPTRIETDLLVGTGEPDTTGYFLAIYSMLIPYLGKYNNIRADFDNKVLQGKILIKGKVTVYIILLCAGRVYFDKQLRVLLKKLKREDI